MKFSARQIADLVSGTIDGDPLVEIHTVAKIEEAGPGSLAFLANPKYYPFIYKTGASIVLVQTEFVPDQPVKPTLIRVQDPYSSFATLLEYYQQFRLDKRGISPLASIHPTAVIGEDCYIGDFTSIGEGVVVGKGSKIYPQVYLGDNVTVGEDTTIHPGVKVYFDTKIGSHCIIHSGVVLGADGFGFAVQSDHQYKKVPQIGNVVIEDYVELGANTAIDRATLGSTIIRRGVKLDNFVQVAHNVEIGEDTVIAAHTGISGSTKVGSRCIIAGQVGFNGHIQVADDVKVGAQSGVAATISEAGVSVLGTPAIDASLNKRMLVWFRRLPELGARISALEKLMKQG